MLLARLLAPPLLPQQRRWRWDQHIKVQRAPAHAAQSYRGVVGSVWQWRRQRSAY
eukprot:COSAG01_NODE_27272_length_690_cov_0.693739_1_plen_55_part_00